MSRYRDSHRDTGCHKLLERHFYGAVSEQSAELKTMFNKRGIEKGRDTHMNIYFVLSLRPIDLMSLEL